MKKYLLSLVFVITCGAFGQQYTCSFVNAQTYNTLDTGSIQSTFQNTYTFIYPSSGSLAVTTGVLTLTTALDATYPNAYMYFPAGTWTSSTAGWYYVQCSSTTSCIVYSNAYTSGIPTTPLAPALVTTGAGAYTQTTGAYINAQSFTLGGNVLGANGRMFVEVGSTNDNSANAKFTGILYGGQVITATLQSTATGAQHFFSCVNKGLTNSQICESTSGSGGSSSFLTVDSTQPQTLQIRVYQTTATDFIVIQHINVQVTK